MWPEDLILENIISSDLGRITYKLFCILQFQSLVSGVHGVQAAQS